MHHFVPIHRSLPIRAGGLDGVGVTTKKSGMSKSGVSIFLYFCSLQSGILLDGTLVYFNVVIYTFFKNKNITH